jgi:hypothetical protein
VIRHSVAPGDLIARINAAKPTWMARARQRTAEYVSAGSYTGGSEFWGEIKGVYINLQREKCAYCETKLAGSSYAIKVHEVEHFRPKASIKAWPDPAKPYLQNYTAPCATGTGNVRGYYRLAYHPFNYAIACTRCNSTLKSNYFPVRGRRRIAGADPSALESEQQLLVYPISNIDDDPSKLIDFDGVLAVPRRRTGFEYERANVTITFFQLNHQDLTTRRAQCLWPLFVSLEARAAGAPNLLVKDAQSAIQLACESGSEFSACMSAFVRLHANNRTGARQRAEAARALL